MNIPEKHRELAERHKNGALIEVRHQDGTDRWAITEKPLWQDDREYRIRPPLTLEEMLHLEQVEASTKSARANAEKDHLRLKAMGEETKLQQKVANQQRTKVGQIIAISTGSYSNYQVACHMRALAEFGTVDEMVAFKASDKYMVPPSWAPEREPSVYGSTDRFIAWLQAKGLIEPIEADEVMEWWIGEDGRLVIE